jgi:TonB-linked SusC/RagA family outer membrane protein
MKKKITYIVLLLISTQLFSQQIIKGTIVDKDGVTIPGVNIVNEKAAASSVSDFDGNFAIKSEVGDLLKFSMLGYDAKTVKASNDMRITLEVGGEQKLDEVVLVGFGTKKKGVVTGSVSQIKSEVLMQTPAKSAMQSIQGKAAGVSVVSNDEPGGNPTVTIRGLGTILGARSPLYVIDGVQSDGLNGLSSNDIATMDILKDAASTAIYGQRGANGVVFITTKKGKIGKSKIAIDSYYGQKDILTKVKMSDSYRFAYYNNTALGSSSYFNFTQPYNTNWLDAITRTGNVFNNSVSLSGASENINYYLGVSNYEENGILIGTNYRRNNIVNKNEYKFSDKFKLNQFINVSVANNTPMPVSAFTNAYKQSPIVPVRYPNGRFGVPFVNPATGLIDITGDRFNNVGNPVAQLYNTYEENQDVVLTGSLNAELQIVKDLKFNSVFGATGVWTKGYTFSPNRDIWLAQNPSLEVDNYEEINGKDSPINTLEQRRSDSFSWNWDNYFTYKKQFGDNNLTVVLGASETVINNSEFLSAQRYNVPEKSNYWYLNFSSDNSDVNPSSVINNSHSTPIVNVAYFTRVEYDYKGKYLVTGIFRREGISSFQDNQKWGNFPGFSAGWVVSKEEFMDNVEFLNLLKLRGGYGQLANGNGPTYNNVAFSKNAYPFGNPTVSQPGIYIANAVDPNLTWESVNELDFGLDFAMLQNRLTGTLDYYNKVSDNLILPVSPPYVLSEEPTFVNAGSITNKGFEVTLRWDDSIGDNFHYYVGGNFSNNKNEVSKITSSYFQNFSGSGSLNNGEYTKLVKKGEPLGSFYVFDQIGYNSDGAPIFNDMIDGIAGLTDNDRINAGSYIPQNIFGLNLGFTYKNIDFLVDTYAVTGNKLYNGKKAQRFGGENIEYAVLDNFWTPSNPNALNPKPSNDVPRPSTYYVEDGSFFRINNITLGYTIPMMTNTIDKVRLFVTATNPFIFTNFSGYSPELSGNDNGNPLGTAGIELDAYPTNKTFLFGVNLSF